MSVWIVLARMMGCVLILMGITAVIVLILDTMVPTVRQVCSAITGYALKCSECHGTCSVNKLKVKYCTLIAFYI